MISIAGTLILKGDILTNDEVTVEPYGLLIPVARDLTETIYSCPTKGFLCQNGKSPTINTTSSDINILGLVNGIGQGFPANTGPGANSSLMDSQNDPSNIYGANHAGIGTVSEVPGIEEIVEEFHTINHLNMVLGGIDLNYKPLGDVALNIVHGPSQVYGLDYILIGDFVSWDSLGLMYLIAPGDTIRVIYQAYTGRTFPDPKGTYGSYEAPTSIGSGSGEVSGGSGIKLVAHSGTVNISGTINVSGENGVSNRTGGGSGGSIWIDSYNILGGGPLYAEGGDASYAYAGGGGGGYITLNYENQKTFNGLTSVIGHKGGSHGLVTIEKREPFFTEKFTGTILNTKWWEVINEPVELNNVVQMDTTTNDLRIPRLESKFEISGKNIQIDCDFLPTGVEPSYHTSYFQMFIDDRNWVQIARKHNNIFGMYNVDGFLSQTAQPHPYTDTVFRIIKTDSTFSFQYFDATTGPQTIVSDVIPDFQTKSFKIALGTIKDEPDSSNYVTDYFKLTNIDEYNGYVTLSSIPLDASYVTLNVIGGGSQIYGVDFTVSGQNLSWIPASLNLQEDDEISAQYMEDGTFNNLQIAWDNFEIYNGIVRGLETTRPIIHVDSVYGSDASDGGPLSPLKNLFVATAWAKKGGTVVLYSGNYNPTEIERKNLTIMGANGSTAFITAAQDTTGSNWENSCITFHDCQGKVSNIHMSQAREGVYAEDVQNLEINNCQIYDVTTAVKFINYSKDCKVTRNTIHDVSTGVDFGFQNYNPYIYSNVIYDSSTATHLSDASNFIISSNTFDSNSTGIIIDSSSMGVIASNNLTNSNVGIEVVDADSTVGLNNNNFYGTNTAITGSGTITDSSSIYSDPAYANQYLRNYHLLFFSTDRSTGTGLYDQFKIDRDGAERANDPSYDIGAYRYINAPHPAGNAYYVDGSGNDFLNNGTPGSFYRTLDKAMTVADSSVIITGGHYDTYYLKLKSENILINTVSILIYPADHEYILYYHVIDSVDTLRGFFYLPVGIDLTDPSNIALNIVHSPAQYYGTDFVALAGIYGYPKIYWKGLGLDGLLDVGDVVRVMFKEGSLLMNPDLLTLHGQYSDLNLGRAVYVSPNGSDSTVMGGDGTNSGGNGTYALPYCTISHALSQSSSGDNLVVMAGEYPLFNGLDDRIIVPYNDRTGITDGRMYFEDLFNTSYTMYPNHNLSGVSWYLDTTATSEVGIVEGYLHMSFDGTHPVTATSLFEFSPIGTDRTAFEVSAELRQAFDPIFFSVYNGPNVATFWINNGDYTCNLMTDGKDYSCWGHFDTTVELTDLYFTEYVCITSTEIQNKFCNLSYLIGESSEVVINIIGGTSQELGTDFYVQNNMIKWDGMVLDGEIKAGDVLRVMYIPHGLSDPVRVKFMLKDNTMTVMGVINGHYERLMKRTIHSPITGPWSSSFYMDTVEHINGSTGRGYVSRFLAIAESFENSLAKPYEYKTWRQPIVLHE